MTFPRSAFFLRNVLQLHQQKWLILRVDSLALWKVINEEDAFLIPKKSKRELFQLIFALGIFLVWLSRYVASPLIVALSPGHSDITRFRPWSPIATANHLDRAEKIPNIAQATGTVDVFDPRSGIGTHFAESFRKSKSSWMMGPACIHEFPSCSAIDLAEIRLSSKFSSWLWSIISGVVTVLGRPGRGAWQVEKSPRLNWATQFLTVAYDSVCSSNVFCQNGVNFLRRLALQEIKNLLTTHVSMLLESRASPDVLPFNLCNKERLAIRHMNRPLFPKTQSIPSYDIGKQVGLRTYYYPLVHISWDHSL